MAQKKIYASPIIANTALPSVTNELTQPTTLGTGIYASPTTPSKTFNFQEPARVLLSDSLNTLSKRILQQYEFRQDGAIQIGVQEVGVSGDIKLSPAGIVARNQAGITTFALDGTTGNATFLGTVQAGSIVTGYLAVGSAAADVNSGLTTISGGKITANSITAAQIAAGTITATEIHAATITGSLIAPLTITAANIAAGTITADKISANYLEVGDAAADVNAGSTQISGGKIVAGSLTVSSAEITSLSANKLTAGTINASIITVTNLNASNLSVGSLPIDRVIQNSITGGSGGKIALSTITDANIGSLNANKITAGTISVGGSGQPNAISITQGGSGSSGNSRLIWTPSNSRIWADSNGNIGINSLGSDGMYIYENNSQRAYFKSGSQANFAGGVYTSGNINAQGTVKCRKIEMNQDVNEGSLEYVDIIKGYNDLRLQTGSGGERFKFLDNNGNEQFSITPNGGGNTQLAMNGYSLRLTSNKTAILPTSQGFRALYSAEAPEVWFFDFVKNKKVIDPLFLEVTEGEVKFIKVLNGGYQIWRRRKGHADLRFAEKTAFEFYKNEMFLRMARV